MMHGNRMGPAVLCWALALVPWWAGAQQMTLPPAPVVVDEVRRTEISPTVSIPGTILSRADSRLATEVAGRVIWFADVGTVVSQGDPVVQLESTTLDIQREEYRGQVQRERGRLTFLEPEVDRLEILAAESIAAESLLDQTRSNLEVARGDLVVAEARLRQVEDQISKMTIVAPFDGVVSERLINPGEMINRMDEVIRLVSPESIEVTARAPLNAVAFLDTGSPLPIYNDYRRGTGTVRTIVTFGDPQSHMFELRIDVPAEQWIVGESVRIDVPTEAPKQALAVPRDALVLRRDGAFVFRVGPEQRAQRVPVMPGVGDGDLIEVDGALAAGDVIVIRGAERLMEGQPVQVIGS